MQNFAVAGGTRDRAVAGRVRNWVRTEFALPADASLVVTEIRCGKPGCPPRETVIAVLERGWPAEEYKLRKPLAQVMHRDVADLLQERLQRRGAEGGRR